MTKDPSPGPRHRDSLGIERLVFFSDAVFAISITLLALDLRLPARTGYTDASLLDALGQLRPAIFAFLLSFFVTATFWVGHFRTFRLLERIDSRLIALDLVFLCWVVLLPFPTSIVATEGDLPTGAVLYAVFVTVGGLLSAFLWIYAAQIGKLVSPRVTPELARRIAIRALVAPAVFAATIPLSLVDPLGAEIGWILAPVAQAIVGRHYRLGPALDRSLGSIEEDGAA
ncbi:MAG TPA: TMEM175 family protein [Candidatus Dormibacteraeota bacterium]|nr:TMEM175 family protein [Candidatus Dormibacteraeota bacterium]